MHSMNNIIMAIMSAHLAIRFVLVFIQSIGVYLDHRAVSDCPDPPKYFVGIYEFGGRFKFLTYLTLLFNFAYFLSAFIVEILDMSTYRIYTDWLFTTCCTTMSCVTVIFFWGLFLLDRDNIYPKYLDDYLPPHCFQNHFWHTWPLIACIIECIFLSHYYPQPSTVLVTLASWSLLYISCILVVYRVSGFWVYPFMEKFSVAMFVVFFAVSCVICGLFYISGRSLSSAFGQIRSAKQKVT